MSYIICFLISALTGYLLESIVHSITVANGWKEVVIEELTIVSKYYKKDSDYNIWYYIGFIYNGKPIMCGVKSHFYSNHEVGEKTQVKIKLTYVKGLLKKFKVLELL